MWLPPRSRLCVNSASSIPWSWRWRPTTPVWGWSSCATSSQRSSIARPWRPKDWPAPSSPKTRAMVQLLNRFLCWSQPGCYCSFYFSSLRTGLARCWSADPACRRGFPNRNCPQFFTVHCADARWVTVRWSESQPWRWLGLFYRDFENHID